MPNPLEAPDVPRLLRTRNARLRRDRALLWIIAIHDIPYEIAKRRNHPQQDAIHVAGWISLFTLHVLWPFLWIWATLYREDRGWGFQAESGTKNEISELKAELETMSARLQTLEKATET